MDAEHKNNNNNNKIKASNNSASENINCCSDNSNEALSPILDRQASASPTRIVSSLSPSGKPTITTTTTNTALETQAQNTSPTSRETPSPNASNNSRSHSVIAASNSSNASSPLSSRCNSPHTPHTSKRFGSAMSLASNSNNLDDLKAANKMELLPTTQKIKKLVRRNASDKLRLIHMVRDNPILWDSRMPNFKGAEEEKNRAWEQIGKEFNAPGRRVARAFKSLRESYRRELAHVKIMGSDFKPKWGLYEAMDFLRDVIRERKGGSHAAENATMNSLTQHLHHNNNNNNNNNNSRSSSKYNQLLYNESALNLSKCSNLSLNRDEDYYNIKPELDMSTHSNGVAASVVAAAAAAAALAAQQQQQNPLPAHQQQQHQQLHSTPQQPHHQQHQLSLPQQSHDSRVSSTRNDSLAQNSSTFDEMDTSSLRSADEASMRNAALSHQGSDEVEELEAIDADFPYPLILDGNSPRGGGGGSVAANGNVMSGKRKRRGTTSVDGGEGVDDDDDYEGQMLQQHRHLRQQNGASALGGCMLDMPPAQTVREVLNSKFCGFISAKLNSMEDAEADNLIHKILMLLVQTQGNDTK